MFEKRVVALPARLTMANVSFVGLHPWNTFAVQFTAWSKDLRVTADGTGAVTHVGTALLRIRADRSGVTAALSGALSRREWTARA